MRIVAIGDLVLDYYYKDGKILGVCGGMTSHNIICNLAKMGFSTAVIGTCGDDLQGCVALNSLTSLKVNTDYIKILNNYKTKCFHISYNDNIVLSKKKCPFCNEKKWYDLDTYDKDLTDKINKDDILIFDNLSNKNQFIIDTTNNIKIIDLGQFKEFEGISNDDLLNKILNKFEIINLNNRVSEYLINRFNLLNELELYNLLKPNFMTITKSSKGANFIYNNHLYKFKLNNKKESIDSTGAGDAFLSSVIKDILKNNFNYDNLLFQTWYDNSVKLTRKVVSKYGARSHLCSLYKIKKINDVCICNNFVNVERKKIKRCNININNLKTRLFNALSTYDKLNIDFNSKENYAFIGTGGSYAASYFASLVINTLYGANTYSMYPRDFMYRNNNNIDKVILFSYSGTTNDIIKSINNIDNNKIYMITKGDVKNIVTKTNIKKANIISYKINNTKERGFLSFEGVLSPSLLFLKYYIDKSNIDINLNEFILNSIDYWNDKLSNLIDNEFILKIKANNIINIFRGDYTNTATYDLESKIIESGVSNVLIHEKKNFSHGRFINYENLNNKCSIYFKQNYTSKYEKELLKYLNNEALIIESKYNGILAEYDLLIASSYIIYYIGKMLDIDVSKPIYSDKSMNLYFYKSDII